MAEEQKLSENIEKMAISDMPKLEDLTWRCFESEKDLAKIM